MTPATIPTPPRDGIPKGRRELCVIVTCHQVVCAIPTECIVRLALPEDAVEIAPGILDAFGERYTVWDLGERLGFAKTRDAWCLLRIPAPSGPVSIALATGPCRVVAPLPRTFELPAALFSTVRGAAIAGIFADRAGYGVVLDPIALWTPAELGSSAALLRSVH